jgi:hypothetical protein
MLMPCARSTGLDDEILGAAHEAALAIPDGAPRLQPGAAFAPAVPIQPGNSELDTIVALLGRRPEWPAALP